MKCKVEFEKAFVIPANLPNAYFEDDEEENNICHDVIEVIDDRLVLSSLCGSTTFRQFREVDGGWEVSAQIAAYEGAYNALNTIYGIKFPDWHIVGVIQSSYGEFRTLAGYELAREAISAARTADGNGTAAEALDALKSLQSFIHRLKISARFKMRREK